MSAAILLPAGFAVFAADGLFLALARRRSAGRQARRGSPGYSLTALARREPRARLYSALPRESQCPSTLTCVLVHFFIQSAFFCRWRLRVLANLRLVEIEVDVVERAYVGVSSATCALKDLLLGERRAAAALAPGPAAAAVAAASPEPRAAVAAVARGAGGGTFLWQPAAATARTRLSPSTDASRRRVIALLTFVEKFVAAYKLDLVVSINRMGAVAQTIQCRAWSICCAPPRAPRRVTSGSAACEPS